MKAKTQNPEKISEIATIIRKDWTNIYFGAKPYLDAMERIDSIDDQYFEDSASTIITYFLANAKTWHGKTAKAVKAKLNVLLKSAQ